MEWRRECVTLGKPWSTYEYRRWNSKGYGWLQQRFKQWIRFWYCSINVKLIRIRAWNWSLMEPTRIQWSSIKSNWIWTYPIGCKFEKRRIQATNIRRLEAKDSTCWYPWWWCIRLHHELSWIWKRIRYYFLSTLKINQLFQWMKLILIDESE